MIRDPEQTDNVTQIRMDNAIAERELWRRRYFDEIKDYNAMRRDHDMMAEELAFLREQIGEAAWSALAEKYERLNCRVLLLKAGVKA